MSQFLLYIYIFFFLFFNIPESVPEERRIDGKETFLKEMKIFQNKLERVGERKRLKEWKKESSEG